MRKLILILLLAGSLNADVLIVKIGSRGLTNGFLETDFRSNQIVDIVDDKVVISAHTKTHFRCIQVKEHFTPEQKAELVSPDYEYDKSGKPIGMKQARKYYVAPEDVPTIKSEIGTAKEASVADWYAKDTVKPVIDLTDYKYTDFVAQKNPELLTVSTYDKGGSISSGTFTIGSGMNYTTPALWAADIAAVTQSTVTGTISTNEWFTTGITWGRVIAYSTSPIILNVAAANRHSGFWDSTKAVIVGSSTAEYGGTAIDWTQGSLNNMSFITMDGLQIRHDGYVGMHMVNVRTSSFTVKNCLSLSNNRARTYGNTSHFYLQSSTAVVTFINCGFKGGKRGDGGNGINSQVTYTSTIPKINVYNCFISSTYNAIIDYGWNGQPMTNVWNTIGQNNVHLLNWGMTSTAMLGGYNLTDNETGGIWGGGTLLSYLSTGTITMVSSRTVSGTPADAEILDVRLAASTSTLAIDSGLTIATFSDDIVGTTRPQGTDWDRGAFEYIASSVQTLIRRRRASRIIE
jgi:hypothetical protein